MEGNRQVPGFDPNRRPEMPLHRPPIPVRGAAKVEKIVAKNPLHNPQAQVREVPGKRNQFVVKKHR